jgi:hypothetical protein
MIAMLPELRPHRGPYKGLGSLLPRLKQPSWVWQAGKPKYVPPAPSPVVAHAQMRERTRRARRSLAKRGVKGFMAALAALPSSPELPNG